jgi:rhodanese-related sulfurtransferase
VTDSTPEVKRINVQEAQEKLASGKARVIDIRMPFDYAGGRIPGSLNLPNNAIRSRKGEVPEDKELLFLSEDGERSMETCRLAISLGFNEVFNIDGGFTAWAEARNQIETISEGIASQVQQPQ